MIINRARAFMQSNYEAANWKRYIDRQINYLSGGTARGDEIPQAVKFATAVFTAAWPRARPLVKEMDESEFYMRLSACKTGEKNVQSKPVHRAPV